MVHERRVCSASIPVAGVRVLGVPEYSGLIGVIARGALMSPQLLRRDCREGDSSILMCSQSWLPWVPFVELLPEMFGMFEVVCGVPSFVVFW